MEALELGLVWVYGYLWVCRGFEGDGGIRVGFVLGLWLFVGLSICGFEGDGGVRVGFVGLREMAGRQ
jgi:hypothetical protein